MLATAPRLQPLLRWGAVILSTCVLVPTVCFWFDAPHLVTLATRIAILSIAAISLNLLIGTCGLVSFGHGMYLAIGAYSVSILQTTGVDNGFAHFSAATVVAGIAAALIGPLALRTSGIAFIMVTLAFAQMFFYLMISLRVFGGDDGMSLAGHSLLGPLDLGNRLGLFEVSVLLLAAITALSQLFNRSTAGYALRAARQNVRRAESLGLDIHRLRRIVYVVSAVLTADAGSLFANLNSYVSPSYSAWPMSGDLILIVVLGGMGSVFGPIVGAIFLLSVESFAPGLSEHWMLPYGIAIVWIVMTARHGLLGALLALRPAGKERRQ